MLAFGDYFFLSIWGLIDDLALWLFVLDAVIQTPKLVTGVTAGANESTDTRTTVQSVVQVFRMIRLLRLLRLLKPLMFMIRNRLVVRVNSNLLMG